MTDNTPQETPDDAEGHVRSFDYEAGEIPVEGGRRHLPVTGDQDDAEGHRYLPTATEDDETDSDPGFLAL